MKITLKYSLFLMCAVCLRAGQCFGAGGQTSADILTIVPDAEVVSMGGNCIALPSNRPSGAFNNPASLDGADRNMVTFFQAAYPAGLGYSYAGIAIPTISGNLGISMSIMNYQGVDSYDANFNKISLDDSYDAIVNIGYSLPIARNAPIYKEYGSVGVNAKILESKLGDYNAEGLAVDIGAIYNMPFVDGLTAGLALKNLGPDMKYVNESYPIPESTNIGFGYKNLEYENLSAALDFCLPRYGQSYYSMGFSFMPLYFLKLNAGYKGLQDNLFTGFSFGCGLEFGNFRLDYAFMPVNLSSPGQFVSLSMDIGNIVNQKTAADTYLDRHFRQAVDNYHKGDYVEARLGFEQILSVYPGHKPSIEYLTKISDKMDAAGELKDEKVNYYLEKAQAAVQANDFITAKKYYNYVVSLSPESEQARRGIEKLWQQMEGSKTAAIRQEHAAELEELWAAAQESSSSGNLIEAKECLNKMLSIDPTNGDVKTAEVEIDNQLSRISADKTNELFNAGAQLFRQGQYRDALAYFEAVIISAPNRTDAKELAAKCQEFVSEQDRRQKEDELARDQEQVKPEMDRVYDKALSYYAKSNFIVALDYFNKSEELAKRYEFTKFLQNIKKYKGIINDTLSENHYKIGFEHHHKNELEDAANEYKKALEYNPDNLDARTELEKLNKDLAQMYYEKGMTYFARSEMGKAREMFKKSLFYEPGKLEAERALERVQ